VGACVLLKLLVSVHVLVRHVIVGPLVPVRWQWPVPAHDSLDSLGLRTCKAGARATIIPGRRAGVMKWVDNNSNCNIFIQLTVKSLQGDSQLVRQKVP